MRWQWQTNDPRIVLLILGTIFSILGGIFVSLDLVRLLQLGQVKREWQQTSALVIKAEIAELRGQNGILYQSDLKYQYRVAGQNYQGVSLDLAGNKFGTSDFAGLQQRLLPFKQGHQVPVWYDPAHPSYSALNLSTSQPPIFLYIGLPFFLIGLGFLSSLFFLKKPLAV